MKRKEERKGCGQRHDWGLSLGVVMLVKLGFYPQLLKPEEAGKTRCFSPEKSPPPVELSSCTSLQFQCPLVF